MSNNGYFQTPCRKRIITRPVDLDPTDLLIEVTSSPGSDPGTFDIQASLKAKKGFGDIASISDVDSVSLFDTIVGEPSPIGSVDTTLSEGVLLLSVEGVEQTEDNVNSTWKFVFNDLQVVSKDGQTHTIPSITKTFPSPL